MAEEMKAILQNLQDPNAAIREAALDRIGELKPSNAVELIIPFLSDTDPEVRGTAACNLGLIHDNRAIPHLIMAIESDQSEDVRAEALLSLAEYSSPEIADCLVAEVYRKKRSRPPRQEVAKQLRNYNTEQSIEALIALLQDDDVFVRDHAAESLYRLNRPRLQDVWNKALSDQSPDVQDIAKKALNELNERQDNNSLL